jgi:hypothetical protein
VSNRRYRHHLNEDKIKEIVAKLRNDEELEYERIPLYDQSKLEE